MRYRRHKLFSWPALEQTRSVLGDKPELLYPRAQQELRQMGYQTTLQYLKVILACVMVTLHPAAAVHTCEVSACPASQRYCATAAPE